MKQAGFNSIAPYYDRLATFVFGKSIRISQTYYLNLIPMHAKVLVIGGGTGWWLREFQSKNPHCEIWFIEASSEMLNRARKNSSEKIIFIHGNEEDIPAIQFDVVITYYFLDLFGENELNGLIKRISAVLKNDGVWLISDFVISKMWHRGFLFLMYCFFRLIGAVKVRKLPDWQRILHGYKLECSNRKYFFGEFIASCVYRKSIALL